MSQVSFFMCGNIQFKWILNGFARMTFQKTFDTFKLVGIEFKRMKVLDEKAKGLKCPEIFGNNLN